MFYQHITKHLNIKYPIIQAPMAGGVTTSKLVAEVSNAGGLGMIGAGYMPPEKIREQIREIKQLTDRPFGINLFVPNEFHISESVVELADKLLQPIRAQLNIQKKDQLEIPDYESVLENFLAQVQVVVEEKVSVCSFTFGIPSDEIIEQLKQHNIVLIGTATTVKEAVENERAGMDCVVVQGSEAGGHRGNFLSKDDECVVGLMSLVPQVVDNIKIPVIAAGGIMDGRGLMAAQCLGAQAVQMGTAFLTCEESGAHSIHKEAVLDAAGEETVLTRTFSGKWARGLKNDYISLFQEYENFFPTFPVQNKLTQDIRKAAAAQNNKAFMSLWSGQSTGLAKAQTVRSLVDNIVSQAEKIKKGE
ncbi:nitronate monooxygenase [Gracilibacillus oryzae]|uniref:Probable nitronate monooxygenase n=1 Tax=Gracilibacillus oryzae TaxID=1672701 RepID=A0A7C8GUC2_9BACI|nr:nitronate monooxygenase [Gracilibacillus oryzae]KAB8138092.1 nitronate monooxygenase [Gracilibacillus oryzae]